jgi:hypothetical protein
VAQREFVAENVTPRRTEGVAMNGEVRESAPKLATHAAFKSSEQIVIFATNTRSTSTPGLPRTSACGRAQTDHRGRRDLDSKRGLRHAGIVPK